MQMHARKSVTDPAMMGKRKFDVSARDEISRFHSWGPT